MDQSAAQRRCATAAVLILAMVAAGCGAGGGQTGIADATGRQYLGIRYAQPPVGPLRWAPPVPAAPPDPTAETDEPGPACPQPRAVPGTRQDEDCLFLDVTTPRDVRPGERLPVMVWWHGGAFVTGAGSQYDARRLAEQGRVVVVTPNYRLGVLGYLGLPGLPGSGAFGFADQIQSLRWTEQNIAAYGGNPGDVTVAGQSAGGGSACALLTSPALAELSIRKVIVMSGGCSTRLPANGLYLGAPARGLFTSTPDVQAAGRAVAAALGCPPADPLSCLRARPFDTFTARDGDFSSLAWGNSLLPTDPALSVRTSVPPGVAVVYGGTRDEARSSFEPDAEAFVPGSYDALLGTAFGPNATRVRDRYPLSRFGGSAGAAWSAVVTDGAWRCPALLDQRTLAARGPTYAYEVSRADGPPGDDGFPTGGAGHFTEVPLLFDVDGQGPSAPDEPLSRLVIRYWSSFAHSGVPEAPGAPAWPAVAPGSGTPTLQLDPSGVQLTDPAAQHDCAFWTSPG